jgi:signal recognition particle GTPase
MPIIRCTQKLLAEVGTSNQAEAIADLEQSNPLDEWYANLVFIDRQKCVVFINPATLFVAIAYGKRRDELRQLHQVFMESLRQALVTEQVEIEVIDRVVQRFENTQIAKTQDRSTLGCLNDVMRHFKWLSDREQDAPETRTETVVRNLNRIPWVKTSFDYALVPMEQILRETFGWRGRFEKL